MRAVPAGSAAAKRPIDLDAIARAGFPHSAVQASHDGIQENVVILFHGLGDSAANFLRFGAGMKLPHTSVLALQGPVAVLGIANHGAWFPSFEDSGDEIAPNPQESRRVKGMERMITNVHNVIEYLCTSCGYTHDAVFLVGFSHGAMVAVHAGMASHERLGGVVGISSSILDESLPHLAPDAESALAIGAHGKSGYLTPLLVTHGKNDQRLPLARAQLLFRSVFRIMLELAREANGRVKVEAKLAEFAKDHEMVRGPEEARALMEFFASHLVRTPQKLQHMSDVYRVT